MPYVITTTYQSETIRNKVNNLEIYFLPIR